MNNKSFISPDGNLCVTISRSEATWFEFFTLSRITRSPDGGWNYKKFWKERGVNILTSPAASVFLKEWTENSLKDDASPEPRKIDFRFDRKPSLERTNLKVDASDFDSAREEALNWRLYSDSLSKEGSCKALGGIKLLGV